MAEGGGGSIDSAPNQQPTRKGFSIRSVVKRAAEGFRDEFGGDRRMPAEEIQDSTVAYIIHRHLRNPLQGNVPGYNPFTMADVMANAGYTTPLRSTDLRVKFPDVYFKFRDSLRNLSDQGILQTEQMEKPADHKEHYAFFIPHDETGPQRQQKLQELAAQAQQINPKQYPINF